MKKPWIICFLCAVSAFTLMLWGFSVPAPKAGENVKQIVLIMEDDTGAFLSQLKQGAQSAANERGDKLITKVVKDDNLDAQLKSVKEAGAQAVILLCNTKAYAQALMDGCARLQLPLVCLDRISSGECSVLTDEYAAGAEVSRFALSKGSNRLIVLAEAGSAEAERLQGALDTLKDVKVTQYPYAQGVHLSDSALAALRDGAYLVTLGAQATRYAADCKKDGTIPKNVPVVGMDTGERRADDLEGGWVQAMLLPAPYAIGYVALQNAHALAAGQAAAAKVKIPGKLVTLENLYDPENVKLAFPLLQ